MKDWQRRDKYHRERAQAGVREKGCKEVLTTFIT
jgi:hypothetical protein